MSAARPEKHHWIPVNRIYNSLFQNIKDPNQSKQVLAFIDKALSDEDILWFNKVKAPDDVRAGFSSANGRPYGHTGGRAPNGARYIRMSGFDYAFTQDCNMAFDNAIDSNGVFNITTWQTNITNVANKYFEGSQLSLVMGDLNAIVKAWTP